MTRSAAAASAARAAGDPALAARRAAEGLALFRGDVLVDAGDWAHPHRVRLDELRMGLLEDLLAARVELGSGGDVVAELEALVERHPLREGLWASLITALYRAGRDHKKYNALRTGAPYVARHLPWYAATGSPSEEDRYYAAHADPAVASWTGAELPVLYQGETGPLRS